jgi:hypothetical protein
MQFTCYLDYRETNRNPRKTPERNRKEIGKLQNHLKCWNILEMEKKNHSFVLTSRVQRNYSMETFTHRWPKSIKKLKIKIVQWNFVFYFFGFVLSSQVFYFFSLLMIHVFSKQKNFEICYRGSHKNESSDAGF